MAILEHLLKMKTATLATTHYSELKAFALSTRGVENASVEFNVETLRPTYRLSIGVPGKSNAFEISRKLGLPEPLIESAGERLSKEQIRFEDVIANAEYHRQIAEKERKLAEQAHLETQALRDDIEKMRRELEAQRENAMRKAKEDARKVLVKAQREAESIISELKRSRKNEGAPLREHELHEMRARLQSGIDENGERMAEVREDNVAPKDLKPGENVEIIRTGTRAVVVTPPDVKGGALVQGGVMKR